MSLDTARKAWYAKGKAYYQREANSFNFKQKYPKAIPFERLPQEERDFYMARAQQFEQDYGAT